MKQARESGASATGEEIRRALGAPFDNETVAEVLRTGASWADVMQARALLDADEEYMGAELGKKADAGVREVCKILQRERERLESHDR